MSIFYSKDVNELIGYGRFNSDKISLSDIVWQTYNVDIATANKITDAYVNAKKPESK